MKKQTYNYKAFSTTLTVVLSWLLISQTLSAQQPQAIDIHQQQLKALVDDKLNNKHGVGVAVGIIEKDQMRYFVSGIATHQNNHQVLTEDSLFEIGSITKTFTALALADMVTDGTVKLDDSIVQYLPKGIKVAQKDDKPITLLALATHDSGLPRLPSNLDLNNITDPYRSYDQQALYDFLNNYQPTRAVGEEREYSNLGFGLLGHLLSVIDQKPYENVIRDRVLAPLNMQHTYQLTPVREPFVDGHNHLLERVSPWHFDALAGAGALRSSLSDILIYMKANMLGQNKAITLSHQLQTDFGAPNQAIGLAWITTTTPNGKYTWHNGGTGGFRSFIGFNKETQKGVVMMANSVYAIDDIARAYLTDELTPMVEDLSQPTIDLSTDQLNQLTGIYALNPAFKLTVSQKDGTLFVQATGQDAFPVYARSATEFYYKVVKATLKFTVDDKGAASGLTLFQNGQELFGPKE